jgi:predicted flavoprotein YhiN
MTTRPSASRLAGVSVDARVSFRKDAFSRRACSSRTAASPDHRSCRFHPTGRKGKPIAVNLAPAIRTSSTRCAKPALQAPKQDLKTALAKIVPGRLADELAREFGLKPAASRTSPTRHCAGRRRSSTTGNSRRSERKGTAPPRSRSAVSIRRSCRPRRSRRQRCPGLYFIGEVVDVTGHLGGFNFQWAWSSGHAAGQAV